MKDKGSIKRKMLTDRSFPNSEQINQRQNFNRINNDYTLIKKVMMKKIITWGSGIIGAAVIATVVIVNQFKNAPEQITKPEIINQVSEIQEPFISAPIKGMEEPFATYKLSLKDGGIINYKTGSVVRIPANAFLNASGKQISDSIEIKYREFHNALDIFLSGIPMKYDSAGTPFVLESAGMIEILAFDKGEQLRLDEKKPIEIKMASKTNETNFNLYELDTLSKNWVYKGKDKVVDNVNIVVKVKTKSKTSTNEISIKPALADPKKHCFIIKYEKDEFPELAAYENVKFEVTDNNFNPAYYKINWAKISLFSTDTKGSYLVKLKKADTVINVNAIPVFDKENYSKALEKFKKKHSETSKERDAKEFENEAQLNSINKSLSTYTQKDLYNAAMNLAVNTNFTARAFRSFSILRTGIHNIDCPQPSPEQMRLAQFADRLKRAGDDAKKISYNTIFIVEKGKNTVFRYSKSETLRFNPDAKNLMWTVTDKNEIAFFRNIDFKKFSEGKQNNIVPIVAQNQEMAFAEIKKFNE